MISYKIILLFFHYYCRLEKLQDDDSVALRYADNPNGSIHDIAGITNKKGNVLGMMPHPERACDDALGAIDGKSILSTLLSWI